MDFEEMRAAYRRALSMIGSALWPVVEEKPPVVTPVGAAERQLRLLSGRDSWGSE